MHTEQTAKDSRKPSLSTVIAWGIVKGFLLLVGLLIAAAVVLFTLDQVAGSLLL